ncbi:type I restriction-modification system subunit M [Victivallis vadensis]|uniref:site-specific DNA-methyltransferase (adenine-specific) n=1 Tax=Victivallis vadensis TaxID=172901 RepID=A0A2U1AI48_9BACT|nr:class I SAM-dependent DNA methyltransferase [Victivallis vadensis]PVY36050.1 type I restriction enzyme M protein [Victivallis vadensis]
MDQAYYNRLFNFLWNIANDVLVQNVEKGDYKKIILPFIVLRRLDLLLEQTKETVLDFVNDEGFRELPPESQSEQLYVVTGYPFYNTSPFTMNLLKAETDQTRLAQNFEAYLDGYSYHVQDIIRKFDLKHSLERLFNSPCLGMLISKFTDENINLGIEPVLDDNGNEKYPGLDNHTMGTLFEELLRRFNEDFSVTEAGEHYTPRDYVRLLADVAIKPVVGKIKKGTYEIYDAACGTGGILSVSEDTFKELGSRIETNIYGQELQPDTYAICKAEIMISGKNKPLDYTYGGVKRECFAFGSTISQNGHEGKLFDFCISNPPFGTPWKKDLENWGYANKDKITDLRFRPLVGDETLDFLPDIGDPQMLFLANNLSRMKSDTALGTRIVEIHNGSSLFTGDAGQGPSNLRRHIMENDLLEAIIAMPENMFYNTGIGTFVWVVTNRKEARRKGKVQLIDATAIKTPLRKNLGNKNCETNAEDRAAIVKLLTDFAENERSKIFDNDEFGYWSITVERPLRLKLNLDPDLSEAKLKESEKKEIADAIAALPADAPLTDWDRCSPLLNLKKTLLKKARPYITETCPEAEVVEGEPDPKLRDYEQVPLKYEGGIAAFMANEVLPYAPDAYLDESKTEIGYELSFTKYFYKPVELPSIESLAADIEAIEQRTDGILKAILAGVC